MPTNDILHAKPPSRWRVLRKCALIFLGAFVVVYGLELVFLAPPLKWLRMSVSRNTLHTLALGMHNYRETAGHFPPAGTYLAETGYHGWMTTLLPQVDEQALYDRVDFSVPFDHPGNHAVFSQNVGFYRRPQFGPRRSPRGLGVAHLSANEKFLLTNRGLTLEDIVGGTSNTVMVGEVLENVPEWGAFDNTRDLTLGINRSPHGFGGPHSGGVMFALADGSVRFVNQTIDPEILRRLADPSDDLPVGDF